MLLFGTDIRNVIQDILKYAGSCPECNEIMEIRSIALSVWPAQDCFQYVTRFCCEFHKELLFLKFSWDALQHAYNSLNQKNYPDILKYYSFFRIACNYVCLLPFAPR